eukprot:m.77527 g.77527  ORF g.77527 m.77527 type:complete len:93 (+) comp19116_c1_seq1:868-1146(+)
MGPISARAATQPTPAGDVMHSVAVIGECITLNCEPIIVLEAQSRDHMWSCDGFGGALRGTQHVGYVGRTNPASRNPQRCITTATGFTSGAGL